MLTDKLRHETESRHVRIERGLHLLRDDLTLRDHRDLLVRFYGFYHPWEQRVEVALQRAPDGLFARRRKVPLLERDLHWLGVTNLSQLPHCQALPDLPCVARALGSAYVLEGSTLGGQLISRHLERVLGLREGAGYSFYRSYGPQTGIMWRSFLVALERHVREEHHDAAVAAACETFDTMYEWLCGDRSHHLTRSEQCQSPRPSA